MALFCNEDQENKANKKAPQPPHPAPVYNAESPPALSLRAHVASPSGSTTTGTQPHSMWEVLTRSAVEQNSCYVHLAKLSLGPTKWCFALSVL
eukprot:m.345258 g.345258  ORF g.345258 m.345258 type:complete len:93 (-) comp20661_c0_seq4:1309-1587(-)